MESTSISSWALPSILAICVLLIFVFTGLALARYAKKTPDQEKFEQHLLAINDTELAGQEKEEIDVDEKSWWGYWLRLYMNTGRIPENISMPGNLAIGLSVLAFGIGFFAWPRDLLAGAGFAAAVLFGMRMFLNFEVKKRVKTLEKQLPLLIASMRANLQANATPQAALVASVDEVPSPLRDELELLRNDLAFNVPLPEALIKLSDRVPSREMKFLISSLQIAIDSGSNPAPQLEVIQGIIDQRTRIRQKLESAVAEVQPALVVSGVTIPASFVFSLYSSSDNKDFWFSFYGMIGIGVVAALYAIGMLISKKLVNGVENT